MTHSDSPPGNGAAPQTLEQRVLQLTRAGRMREAVACCRQLNHHHPGYASGWYTASQLAGRIGNHSAAETAIDRALALEPEDLRWQLQKAYCLMRLGRPDAARPLLEQLDRLDMPSAFHCAQLALQLSRLGLHQRALHHYQRAIRLEPQAAEHYYNLATVHRFLGNAPAAEQALEEAIRLNPEDFEARKLRADLQRQHRGHNHLEALAADLAQYAGNPHAEVYLNYAMAKELEDLGQWQQSFAHLQRGAAARRARIRYEVEGDIETMAAIEAAFTPALCERGSNAGASGPIFVLGMPRTGTTLVERILGSHSQVQAAGELNDFALALTECVREAVADPARAARLDKRERVQLSTGLDFAKLGARYLQRAAPFAGTASRFVDKMPLNFLYVGLIHLALPGATLVHLRRHPLDSCYAIYKTLFADAYPFSYDMKELARYYAAYDRLMQHWRRVLPGRLHEIHYEDLTRDPEAQTRALLTAAGLEFEPACLQSHRNPEASTTASASQIREPVHSRSVGRWRQYQDELAPLVAALREEGVDIADA